MFSDHERNTARHLDMACSNKHRALALNQTEIEKLDKHIKAI